jgi:sugar phosphate isomerase/epimerase
MKRVLSTYLFSGQKLTSQLLAEIAQAGIPGVEIFCLRDHFDYRLPAKVRELGEWLKEHGLTLHALHAPVERDFAPRRESGTPISIADTERVRRLDAVDEIKRALDVAETVPFRYLVQHLGGGREAYDSRRVDAAFNSLEHLVVFAKQRGVTIALENTPGELASPANLRHFVQETRLGDLRLCFDTGHAHMEDGVERAFEAMRELVVTTHLHDNRGEKDEHLFPYEGTIDWEGALRSFSSAPQELPLVLELKEPPPGGHESPLLDRVVVAFEKLESALASKGEPAGTD